MTRIIRGTRVIGGPKTWSLAGLNFLKQTPRAIPCERLNAVPLVGLDSEVDTQSFLAEDFSLPFHWHEPLRVAFADVHINAERLERIDFRVAFISKITGETRQCSEIF